jgi:hypothetical protein
VGIFQLEPLLPGQRMHLHVFEPRYVALVRAALDGGGSFAMAHSLAATPLHMTVCQIEDVHPLPGRRLNVTVVGKHLLRAAAAAGVSLHPDQYLVAEGAVPPLDLEDEAEFGELAVPSAASDAVGATSNAESSREAARGRADDSGVAPAAAAAGGGAYPLAGGEAATGEGGGRSSQLLADSASLEAKVATWLALVRELGLEQSPRHLAAVLDDLGALPPARCPSRRALWVGALVNPLPGLGVAPEVRPRLLASSTARRRVTVAAAAIDDSLAYLDAHKRSYLRRLARSLGGFLPPRVLFAVAIVVVGLAYESLRAYALRMGLPAEGGCWSWMPLLLRGAFKSLSGR